MLDYKMAVSLWQNPNYMGSSLTITDSESYPDLSSTSVGNNAISSVKIGPGYKLVMYSEPNFKGYSYVISGPREISDFHNIGFDNRAQSLTVTATSVATKSYTQLPIFQTPVAQFYQDSNFKGRYVTFLEPHSQNDFTHTSIKNRGIRSGGIESGYNVTVFSEPGFRGKSLTLNGPQQFRDLKDLGFNGAVQSLVVTSTSAASTDRSNRNSYSSQSIQSIQSSSSDSGHSSSSSSGSSSGSSSSSSSSSSRIEGKKSYAAVPWWGWLLIVFFTLLIIGALIYLIIRLTRKPSIPPRGPIFASTIV